MGCPVQTAPVQLTGPYRLAQALLAITFGLLIFGASVRVHGAGLACPDWPLCFGEVIPTIDFGVFFEFGHRVVAGAVSLGYLALIGWMWARRDLVGRGLLVGAAFGLAVLVVQVILGGLTVLELLAEWTVASHLLAGNTFCLTILLLTFGLYERMNPVERSPVGLAERVFAVMVAVGIPAQLVLGGLVSSSYAGLACGTWPTCDGTNWFPTFAGAVGLQLTHRLVAYALLGLALGGVALTRGRGRMGSASLMLLFLVVVQASIGIANVLLRLPVEITLAHTAGAAGLMLCAAWLNWEAWRAPVASRASTPSVAPTAAVVREAT